MRFIAAPLLVPSLVPALVLPALLAIALGASGCRSVGDAKPDVTPKSSAVTTSTRAPVGTDPGHVGAGTALSPRAGNALAAFAGGCFWGVEDTFRQVDGVVATAVGYAGGKTTNPTYESVCSHTTGHAEAVLVEFDPAKVSYDALLRVFFESHDPTQLNRQGPDRGDQYRSAVFTFSDEQDKAVRAYVARDQAHRDKPIVTQVAPIPAFWKAEEYHQQYDEKTGTHSCPLPQRAPRGT